ncbi:MAG TPA: sigma-70 family RNA polymerase sigma factor [Chromatiales bacterium]|nr:sigma-70 family RNA polymerase sigma factor [Chromatiales bacterium]
MAEERQLAEYLARCAQGDQKALEELYVQTSGLLYGLCLRLIRRSDLAEEVLQDAYLRIWHRAGTFDSAKGSPLTWMISIVRNRALDIMRGAAYQAERHTEDVWAGQHETTDPGPLQEATLGSDARALEECLEQLREEQRRSILMAYYEGYTHSELAQRLGKPLGTVKAWIRRGLEQLKRCLD